jgi:alpha-galactosidase
MELCIRGGYTSGTWGYSNNQLYWISAGSACYTGNSSRTDVVSTSPPAYCIQDCDSTMPQYYPQPNSTAVTLLRILKTAETKNGFRSSARGYNPWGVQALENPSAVVLSFKGST